MDRLLFGGSFDPPHQGHLAVVEYTLRAYPDVPVHVVPAAVSPFKLHSPPSDAGQRLAMLARWRGCLPASLQTRVLIEDLEIRRGPPSYSIETCEALGQRYPGARIGLLVGSDSLADFESWHRAEDILGSYTIFVFRRPGGSGQEAVLQVDRLSELFCNVKADFVIMDNTPVECSSSDIRALLRQGQDRPVCLPAPIYDYIQQHGLYRNSDQ
ncbi:MAG: nicotinate (nicotinamide) nucleotide adenylyltransferase [Spirochaetales bacterium]|nr:nicotinate (nicotinamide) nucleotide adenylyltransferase [Spirochaetales bacterium]